jgi:hypothetical protein
MKETTRVNTNRAIRILLLLALPLVTSGIALSQTDQTITVKVVPAMTVEERVAADTKEKELRKAAEEKQIAAEAEKIAATNPKTLLSHVRILFISSSTDYLEAVQLENALRRRNEVDAWQIAMVGWDKRNVADTEIEIDRPVFTFIFTYKITNRSTGILLATGKVTAFDGNAAAPMLAERIVEEIRKARGEVKTK